MGPYYSQFLRTLQWIYRLFQQSSYETYLGLILRILDNLTNQPRHSATGTSRGMHGSFGPHYRAPSGFPYLSISIDTIRKLLFLILAVAHGDPQRVNPHEPSRDRHRHIHARSPNTSSSSYLSIYLSIYLSTYVLITVTTHYNVEACLRYVIPWLYSEYGTRMLVPACGPSIQSRSYGPLVWAPDSEALSTQYILTMNHVQNRGP